MKEIVTKVYKILENSFVYKAAQILLAPGMSYLIAKKCQFIFKDSRGLILDVGCGPILKSPDPEGVLVGLDYNAGYLPRFICTSRRRGVAGSAFRLPFKSDVFDETRSLGLLHHLDQEHSTQTIKEMARCTKPGGRVIIIDNVWPRNAFLRPIPWLIRKMDRGEWIRQESDLMQLIEHSLPGEWLKKRFSYTYLGNEAIICVFTKRSLNNSIEDQESKETYEELKVG